MTLLPALMLSLITLLIRARRELVDADLPTRSWWVVLGSLLRDVLAMYGVIHLLLGS